MLHKNKELWSKKQHRQRTGERKLQQSKTVVREGTANCVLLTLGVGAQGGKVRAHLRAAFSTTHRDGTEHALQANKVQLVKKPHLIHSAPP